ncbi:DUF6074 family protein [Bradyrhizobium sp. NP1]|uniref:DUF6074 family protein n=1 Tax=Bradyrhizobium sp. NP1 TaxID=3049772 RepID=UPI0025A65B69|nr:DUF6074 family protein [Bradyrhizobium sp. NP1]WJR74914.1 DUF6074 family protein [Bradyrhizobium sp. NP1]
MTERSVVSRVVRDARREMAPASRNDDQQRLHIQIADPKAKVMLLPGRFRGSDYIKRHVEYVLTRDAEQGEQHVRRNLGAIRRTLEEMGVDQAAIDAEVRSIESSVRAEIWRQVLLPGGDR